MNPTKGGFQTRPYSSCLLPTASFDGTHRQVGSVSASVSWHDFGFMKNSEMVSESPGYHHLVPVGRTDQNVYVSAYKAEPGNEKCGTIFFKF